MTQSKSSFDEKMLRNATWTAALLAAAGLALFAFAITTVTFTDWEDYILAGFPVVLTGASIASIYIMRRGNLLLGSGIVFVSNLIVPLLIILTIKDTLWTALLYTAVSSALIIWRSLPYRSWRWSIITAVAVLITIVVIDLIIAPPNRFANPPEFNIFIVVLILVLSVAFFAQAIREAWNRSYTISRKLYIAFGLLLALTLMLAVAGQVNLNRVQGSYENSLAGGIKIRNLTDHLNAELLEASRREGEFLLRWREEGFETAYENYVVVNQEHTGDMKGTLSELSALAPEVGHQTLEGYSQAQYESDIAALSVSVFSYEQSFAKLVALIQARGFEETGLEGELRDAVHAIEDKVLDVDDPLTITMLQIRRREKDYLLRGDQTYVDEVNDLIAQLKVQTNASETLTNTEKAEIIALADIYLERFLELVDVEQQIAAAIDIPRNTVAGMQDETDRLEAAGEQLADLELQAAATNSQQSFLFTLGIGFAVLVASVYLAIYLSGQLTRPITQLTTTAGEIAGGNFDVQAEVTSADEIGALAQTFNNMTKRLGEAFEDVRRRAAELATVADVSTATSTILETKQLLQEVVDLTKERFNLYHSHIYLLDEEGENLVLAAGAGEPGRVMVSEGRSIPLDREQSLVARAARERQGVTVNDVTQEPDHLPNPLLPDTRSELAVPMIVGGNVIGVFDIQSEQVGRFTDTDVNIQTTLAAQMATSIQNVRSFERSRKEAELQSLVNLIGSRIQRATSIEETLQTAIRELGTAIGASRVKAKIQPASKAVSTEPTAAN